LPITDCKRKATVDGTAQNANSAAKETVDT